MNMNQYSKRVVLPAIILMSVTACSNISHSPEDSAATELPAAPVSPSSALPSAAMADPGSADSESAAPDSLTAEPAESQKIRILPGFNPDPVEKTADDGTTVTADQQVIPFEEELNERSRETDLMPADEDLDETEPVGNLLKIPL